MWRQVDKDLSKVLPSSFSFTHIQRQSSEALILEFDDFLYEFFSSRFPWDDAKCAAHAAHHHHVDRKLSQMRALKRQARKAYYLLQRNGLGDSPEAALLARNYRKLLKQHNKLRRELAARSRAKEMRKAERNFKKDPWAYSSVAVKGPHVAGSPQFDEKVALEYFAKIYTDPNRQFAYTPLKDMVRPLAPTHPFNLKRPSLDEFKRIVRRKRNAARPGINGISYVPYKQCPAILRTLHKICVKIWQSGDIPREWGIGCVALLAKSDKLTDPAEFRPISLTNTNGKIYFSCISERLDSFMAKNGFLQRSTQKAFAPGIPGCLEHSFGLFEALREAKQETRQIVVTWIDLCNAFGSVRHNLVQFALAWYHVPAEVCKQIFCYYETLCAFVATREWQTPLLPFQIGLFQGCVLSPILFNAVFNLLLDYLKPLSGLGYSFKWVDVTNLLRAFADDLTIMTKTTRGNQQALDRTSEWLDWSQTMKAKPRKCVHVAFRQFLARDKSEFQPVSPKSYSAFDAKLTISGSPIGFMLNPDVQDRFKQTHFKFLGRNINISLNEHLVQEKLRCAYLEYLEALDKNAVNGLMKLWIYQHYVLSLLSWPFLVYELNLSFASGLETTTNVYLRKWAGLYRRADAGLLYRSREQFGLGLSSLTAHYRCMQTVKCHLLQNSQDIDIVTLYNQRASRESSLTRVWKPTKLLPELHKSVNFELKFGGQADRCGLGTGRYDRQPSVAATRKLLTKAIRRVDEEKFLAHATSLGLQGVWTKWKDCTMPLDLSWKFLLSGVGPKFVSFLLNASINCAVTPDLLRLWGYASSGNCKLCGKQGTLFHILCNCSVALYAKKYTWRHDSVLATLQPLLSQRLRTHNFAVERARTPGLCESFCRVGEKKRPEKSNRTSHHSILTGATDWKYLVDFDRRRIVFPPHICATNERPDIVIWSDASKCVILIELTCPAEENISAAASRKKARYARLEDMISKSSWCVKTITIEVGCRGFVALSTRVCLRRLGFTHSETSQICKSLSLVVARCSYAIYLARDDAQFDSNQEYITTLPKFCQADDVA